MHSFWQFAERRAWTNRPSPKLGCNEALKSEVEANLEQGRTGTRGQTAEKASSLFFPEKKRLRAFC